MPAIHLEMDYSSYADMMLAVTHDVRELEAVWAVNFSPTRCRVVTTYFEDQLAVLKKRPFDNPDAQAKVDRVLLEQYCGRQIHGFAGFKQSCDEAHDLMQPFAGKIVDLIEHELVTSTAPIASRALDTLMAASVSVRERQVQVSQGHIAITTATGRFAAEELAKLPSVIDAWQKAQSYPTPRSEEIEIACTELAEDLKLLANVCQSRADSLLQPNYSTQAVQPCGAETLSQVLRRNFVKYSPQELRQMVQKECMEMQLRLKQTADECGLHGDWKRALEEVADEQLERRLTGINRISDFLQSSRLLNVPSVARATLPLTESYNSLAASFASHLREYVHRRSHRSYRSLHNTILWMRGWDSYVEWLLLEHGFAQTGADKLVSQAAWLRTCAEAWLCLSFQLGDFTLQECSEKLAALTMLEKAQAEAVILEGLGQDCSPVELGASWIGSLQLRNLRMEVLEKSGLEMDEKEFHDWILWQGGVPVGLIGKVLLGDDIGRER